jgi:hypothetical protein
LLGVFEFETVDALDLWPAFEQAKFAVFAEELDLAIAVLDLAIAVLDLAIAVLDLD